MEYYSACKNKDNKNFASKGIHLDTNILSEVSQTQAGMHACDHLQINNNHNVQDIHAAFLGSEETKQEERLRS